MALDILCRDGRDLCPRPLRDRRGRLKDVVAGSDLVFPVCLGLSARDAPRRARLWSLASGAAAGFVAPLPTALIGDQFAPALHGVAIGWLRTMTDAGQILGPLALGWLADAVDLPAAFLAGATLLVATAWGCRRHTSRMAVA